MLEVRYASKSGPNAFPSHRHRQDRRRTKRKRGGRKRGRRKESRPSPYHRQDRNRRSNQAMQRGLTREAAWCDTRWRGRITHDGGWSDT